MAATYKQFLAAPSSSVLADTAALHYVTTTTTFAGPSQIMKHLNGLQKQVAKKKEDVFNIVDGQNVIVLEVDTGLGFQTSGGPYLPGLDDNFLSGRDVYLPITHFVTFDEAGKILQIRLQWDQGSLLKQVDVIGKTGRNWPIRDSREQIAFIQGCIRTAGTAAPAAPSHNESIARNRGNSNNAFRDPHASLRLFGPRDEIEDPEPAKVVSPYAGTSNRPRQRSFTEILGDEPTSPSAGRRTMSPAKGGQGKNFKPSRIFDDEENVEQLVEQPSAGRRTMSPAKGGQGKNFKPSRIFNDEENVELPVEQPQHKNKRYIRTDPKKYSHFDFADGSDPQDAPKPGIPFGERPKTKHDSQWDFEDFTTPQKVKPSKTMRPQDVRHWDTDKDAVDETPNRPATKPRRDANTQSERHEDGERMPHLRGYKNDGLRLRKNQLFNKDEIGTNEGALGDITNVKNRGKDFDHHFDITDKSPAHPQHEAAEMENTDKHKIAIAGDGMGGRKGTNRDWLYGEIDDVAQSVPGRKQPNVAASGVPLTKSAKIAVAGDGMGGRRGADRDWLYNETSEAAETAEKRKIAISGDGMGGRRGADRDWLHGGASDVTETTDKRKIAISGDGMGGKKGTDRDWLHGNASDVAETTDKRKIAIAGDGMGGKKGADRDWLYNETSEAAETAEKRKIAISGDGMGGRKGADRDWLHGDTNETTSNKPVPGRTPVSDTAPSTQVKENTDKHKIAIAGDGMGGRKGTNRDWLYGEVDEKPIPTRQKASSKQDFWDF
ncbi:hypothetical protein BKA59DRAFT_469184 [Fusarium tricinctum]|uniref:Uncharacterized protein n=1 Tax=Fusarium tricinctum TaxID=61284 RepID=A0A8K0S5C3_9HYPO|nr:hypothetical protein BKA59DRAFT_469184 [Fusarium tricinctum]